MDHPADQDHPGCKSESLVVEDRLLFLEESFQEREDRICGKNNPGQKSALESRMPLENPDEVFQDQEELGEEVAVTDSMVHAESNRKKNFSVLLVELAPVDHRVQIEVAVGEFQREGVVADPGHSRSIEEIRMLDRIRNKIRKLCFPDILFDFLIERGVVRKIEGVHGMACFRFLGENIMRDVEDVIAAYFILLEVVEHLIVVPGIDGRCNQVKQGNMDFLSFFPASADNLCNIQFVSHRNRAFRAFGKPEIGIFAVVLVQINDMVAHVLYSSDNNGFILPLLAFFHASFPLLLLRIFLGTSGICLYNRGK